MAKDDVWIATAGEMTRHHEAHAAGRDPVAPEIPPSRLEHTAWTGR